MKLFSRIYYLLYGIEIVIKSYSDISLSFIFILPVFLINEIE